MAKAKNSAPKLSVPSMILDSLLSLPGDSREAGMVGVVTVFGAQGLTRDKLSEMLNDRVAEKEHEELLADLEFDAYSVVGKLPKSVTEILEEDSTKRFVLTLKYDEEDGEWILTPTIQTARGRKAKDSD